MGADPKNIFQLQCGFVEHIDRGFLFLAFPLLIPSLEKNWYWKLFGSAFLVLALIAVCNVSGLLLLSLNDVSAHGLLYINPLSRIFEFIAGMCCCLLWRTLQARSTADNGFWIFTLAEGSAIALTTALLIYPFPFAHPAIGPAAFYGSSRTSAIPGFCLIIVVFAFGRGLVSKLLGSKLLEFLGEISFAIYLVHVLVIGATGVSSKKPLPFLHRPISQSPSPSLCWRRPRCIF